MKKPPRDVEFERAAKKIGLKPGDGPVGRALTIGLAAVFDAKREKPVKIKTKSSRPLKTTLKNAGVFLAPRKTRKRDVI